MKARLRVYAIALPCVLLAAVYFLSVRAPRKGPQAPIATSTAIEEKLPASKVQDSTPAALTAQDRINLAKIAAAYSAPIQFYGRVLDQNGQPVAAADVLFAVEDKYFGESSHVHGISDDAGFFYRTGLKGAGLYVEVSKSGYGRLANKSYASFGYGVPSGLKPPSKEYPAIFILRKKGPIEPLIKIASRQFEIPKSGQSVGVNLRNGKVVVGDTVQIAVESWVDDSNKDDHRHFDWRCRITVPGGGLMLRDVDTFEAPPVGYQHAEEFAVSKSQPHWTDRMEREYFLQLKDQTYVRVRFQMIAGGNYNFFTLESYLNPSGSRNLEYDPAKEIKAP